METGKGRKRREGEEGQWIQLRGGRGGYKGEGRKASGDRSVEGGMTAK